MPKNRKDESPKEECGQVPAGPALGGRLVLVCFVLSFFRVFVILLASETASRLFPDRLERFSDGCSGLDPCRLVRQVKQVGGLRAGTPPRLAPQPASPAGQPARGRGRKKGSTAPPP